MSRCVKCGFRPQYHEPSNHAYVAPEPQLATPTERALYRDCARFKAERDRYGEALRMIADGSWNHVLRRMDIGLENEAYHDDPMLFAREVLDAK